MKFTFDHDYHIHSCLSVCSKNPLQTKENILKNAKAAGLKSIALTDHFWDSAAIEPTTDFYRKQNLDHIKQSLPLPTDDEVEFLFGAEADMDANCKIAITRETLDFLDFITVSTTHLHMKGLTITSEDYNSDDVRASLWEKRMMALLTSDMPFHKMGIAHPACRLIDNRSKGHYLNALDQITNESMEKVFAKAAEVGIGVELNYTDMMFSEDEADTVLRMFKIAKAYGCKFYCGSDAHGPLNLLAIRSRYEQVADILGLTENDKFHIEK